MVDQLPLPLQGKVRYSLENFVLHHGVRELFEECSNLPSDSFAVRFILAPPRYGKTHFAIALTEKLLELNQSFPVLYGGAEFKSDLESGKLLELFGERGANGTTVIVDDADRCLAAVFPGESGPFVALVELLRKQRSRLVLLSSVPADKLPCDEHVMSRLRSGLTPELGPPADCDLEGLLNVLSRQRGVSLSERSRKFLLKRLRREIPALEHYVDRALHLSQVLGRSITFKTLPAGLELDQ